MPNKVGVNRNFFKTVIKSFITCVLSTFLWYDPSKTTLLTSNGAILETYYNR